MAPSAQELDQPRLLETLRRTWGFDALRPLQEEAIRAGLIRRDSLVVMPTGGGKSLCYQVPPLMAGRTDVVVSPLISLMKDQVDGLRACGYPAAALHSNLDEGERQEILAAAVGGPATACSSSRPSGWPCPPSPSCYGRSRSRPSPWTRLTASATGATTSGPSTASWPPCGRVSPGPACTPSPPRPRRGCARTSSHQLQLEDPLELVGRFDRPNLTYRVVPRVDLQAPGARGPRSGTRARPHRLLHHPQGYRDAWPRSCAASGVRAAALPRGAGARTAAAHPGGLRRGAARRGGGHGRLRHGHRSQQRALRDPRGHAQVHRALPAGDGPGRSRRPGGRVRAASTRRPT